jgi:uncharacterized protein (UPF0548 family)
MSQKRPQSSTDGKKEGGLVRGDERERVGDGEERFSRRGLLMLWGSQR